MEKYEETKSVEKYEVVFDELCIEDKEDIITICSAAQEKLRKAFKIDINDPKILGVMFSKIYDSFFIELKKLESNFEKFNINIAGRLDIGFTTSNNEDDEKNGNFMAYIRHKNKMTKDGTESFESGSTTTERLVQWNTENIIDQSELLRKISISAIEALKEVDINLTSSEVIIPLFIIIYEEIVNYIKVKRSEIDSIKFEINFMGCFQIAALEDAEDIDKIVIRPSINTKLLMKDDERASSKYE